MSGFFFHYYYWFHSKICGLFFHFDRLLLSLTRSPFSFSAFSHIAVLDACEHVLFQSVERCAVRVDSIARQSKHSTRTSNCAAWTDQLNEIIIKMATNNSRKYSIFIIDAQRTDIVS